MIKLRNVYFANVVKIGNDNGNAFYNNLNHQLDYDNGFIIVTDRKGDIAVVPVQAVKYMTPEDNKWSNECVKCSQRTSTNNAVHVVQQGLQPGLEAFGSKSVTPDKRAK